MGVSLWIIYWLDSGTRHSCAQLWNSSYKLAATHSLKKYVVDLNSQALFWVSWEYNLRNLVLSNNSAQIFQSSKFLKAMLCSLLSGGSIFACISGCMSPVLSLLFVFVVLCQCVLFCGMFSYLVPFNCQFSVAVEQKELGLEAENRELLAFRRKNLFQVNRTISHV